MAASNFRCPRERSALFAVVALMTLLTVGYVFWSSTPTHFEVSNHYGIDAVFEEGENRHYFHRREGDKRVSPWHDIPLRPVSALGHAVSDDHFVFICEIPRGSRAKMEINKEAPFNPIIQDTKKGKPRFYHSDSLVNYGAFPQTWEDPSHADVLVPEYKGDNDPTDVIDVSNRGTSSGDIYVVKVIGALGMVDGGELDWKIVVVDAADVLAAEVDDVAQLSAEHPLTKRLEAVRDWFRDYKLPDGKPANEFSNGGKYYSKAEALKVVAGQHKLWTALVRSERPANAKLWWEPQPNAA